MVFTRGHKVHNHQNRKFLNKNSHDSYTTINTFHNDIPTFYTARPYMVSSSSPTALCLLRFVALLIVVPTLLLTSVMILFSAFDFTMLEESMGFIKIVLFPPIMLLVALLLSSPYRTLKITTLMISEVFNLILLPLIRTYYKHFLPIPYQDCSLPLLNSSLQHS